MLEAVFGYKIMFTFNNQDGSLNGGIANSPQGLVKIFELVRKMDGSNLVIKDETIYVESNTIPFD